MELAFTVARTEDAAPMEGQQLSLRLGLWW